MITKSQIFVIVSCIIGLIVSVALFPLASFSSIFNLDSPTKVNVATALSGLTAPMLGLINIIFLYNAFSEQRKFNKQQIQKNNIDTVLVLINNLNRILADISFDDASKGPEIFKGTVAINKFFRKHLYDKSKEGALGAMRKKTTWDGILYLCESINLAANQIIYRFNDDSITSDMLDRQLRGFFRSYLEHPLKEFSEKFYGNGDFECEALVSLHNRYGKDRVTATSEIHNKLEHVSKFFS